MLAALSWRQSRMYADVETLYRTTISRNPDCWMAHNNLANVLSRRGQVDAAIAHYRKALDVRPDDVWIRNNLGNALASRGQADAAISQYRKALDIEPDDAATHNNLGVALANYGRLAEAAAHFQAALDAAPRTSPLAKIWPWRDPWQSPRRRWSSGTQRCDDGPARLGS